MKQIIEGKILYDGKPLEVTIALDDQGAAYVLKRQIDGSYVWEKIHNDSKESCDIDREKRSIRKELLKKACGWCGGDVYFNFMSAGTDHTHSWVECEKCKCRTGIFESEEPNTDTCDMWDDFQEILSSSKFYEGWKFRG